MKAILKKLTLKNFKGVKENSFDFCNNTMIYGANGTGKSTLLDAYLWLLFGKDQFGRTDFEIKRKEGGEVLHNLEYSVEGVFEIDSEIISLKKILNEKWVKRRGESEREFTGHTTDYLINDVPMKEKEYKEKIDSLFNGELFQMVSSPTYFPTMDWKKRREILFELSGGLITNEDIFALDSELKPLEKELEGKTIEELTAQLTYQKKEQDKRLKDIPVKIDTLTGTIVAGDKEALDLRIRAIRGTISKVEKEIEDGNTVSEKKLEITKKMFDIKSKLYEIELKEKNKVKEEVAGDETQKRKAALEEKIASAKKEVEELDKKVSGLEKEAEEIEKTLVGMREEFKKEAQKTFSLDENALVCPTCKRELENAEEKAEELRQNFNEAKANKLKAFNEKGKPLTAEKERVLEKLAKIGKDKDVLTKTLMAFAEELDVVSKAEAKEYNEEDMLKTALLLNEEYQSLTAELHALEEVKAEIKEPATISERKQKKEQLEKELEEVLKLVAKIEMAEETKEEIKKLEAEQKKLVQSVLNIEKLQFLVEKFVRTKSRLIEKNINSRFKNVEFKLFDEQVNGGIKEVCTVMVRGIEYGSANTAGRLNAGLDIISALSEHYNYYVPVWIDNRESVTEIADMGSQVINLVVDEKEEHLLVLDKIAEEEKWRSQTIEQQMNGKKIKPKFGIKGE